MSNQKANAEVRPNPIAINPDSIPKLLETGWQFTSLGWQPPAYSSANGGDWEVVIKERASMLGFPIDKMTYPSQALTIFLNQVMTVAVKQAQRDQQESDRTFHQITKKDHRPNTIPMHSVDGDMALALLYTAKEFLDFDRKRHEVQHDTLGMHKMRLRDGVKNELVDRNELFERLEAFLQASKPTTAHERYAALPESAIDLCGRVRGHSWKLLTPQERNAYITIVGTVYGTDHEAYMALMAYLVAEPSSRLDTPPDLPTFTV